MEMQLKWQILILTFEGRNYSGLLCNGCWCRLLGGLPAGIVGSDEAGMVKVRVQYFVPETATPIHEFMSFK